MPRQIDFACRGERVEIGAGIAVHAGGQDLGFENRGRDRRPLQVLDRIEQRVEAAALPREALPRRDQTRQHGRIDWLDLLAQLCERAPPDRLQDLRVAPFPARAAGPELALEQPPSGDQRLQQCLDRATTEPVPRRELGRRERTVGPRIPTREVERRITSGLQQRFGKPGRQRDAERVAISGGVFDRDEPCGVGHVHRDDPPLPSQARDGLVGRHRRARGNLLRAEIAEVQQQVVDAVNRARAIALVELLQLPLDVGHRVGVEQLAELGFTEQLAKLRLIDRECLRPAFRQRSIAVVDVVGDVAEEQGGGKGRRHRGVGRDDPDVA